MDSAEPAKAQAPFTAIFDGAAGRVIVQLLPEFTLEDWPAIEACSREHLAEGHLQWTIDLTEFKMVDSRMMGLFIGLNAILSIRGGALELRVRRDSAIARALQQARLARIMPVNEI